MLYITIDIYRYNYIFIKQFDKHLFRPPSCKTFKIVKWCRELIISVWHRSCRVEFGLRNSRIAPRVKQLRELKEIDLYCVHYVLHSIYRHETKVRATQSSLCIMRDHHGSIQRLPHFTSSAGHVSRNLLESGLMCATSIDTHPARTKWFSKNHTFLC